MEFRKKRDRRKVTVFKWRDEKIEEVNEAMYLGYKLQSDNGDGKHIRYITGKANAVVGKIWSLGERKFKEDSPLKISTWNTSWISIWNSEWISSWNPAVPPFLDKLRVDY